MTISGMNKKGMLHLFWFLIAALLLIMVFKNNLWVAALSLAAYSVSLIVYSVVYKLFPGKRFHLTADDKSIIGLAIFFVTFPLALILLIKAGQDYNIALLKTPAMLDGYIIIASIIISVLLTFFEAISSNGFDKLSVPVIAAVMIYMFMQSPHVELLNGFIGGVFLAGIIAALSYRVKFLTACGSVATFLLAGFIFGLGGLKWSIPMMAFFILSSLLSKVRKKQNEKIEQYFEKTGVRDYMQVLANGGIGGLLVILNQFYPNEIYYIVYVAALAAVCADTWATEIGTMVKTNTYNILTFKPVEQGISGGISLVGTCGSLCGAFVIALSGIYWIELNVTLYVLVVVIAGTFGSLFDSFLGATIQAQNQCSVCNKITEREYHCGKLANHFRGYKWMNNDIVNLFAGLTGGVIIIIVYGLL